MDLEKKLQILVACDFSEWRKWRRSVDCRHPPWSIHGFGNRLTGLFSAVHVMMLHGGTPDLVEFIYCAYGGLMLDYSKVPFDEMDTQDEDFRFLFEYKEMLNLLGKKLAVFIEKCHATGFQCSKDWPEIQDLVSLGEEMNKRDYRSGVLDKYALALSELSPSCKKSL